MINKLCVSCIAVCFVVGTFCAFVGVYEMVNDINPMPSFVFMAGFYLVMSLHIFAYYNLED